MGFGKNFGIKFECSVFLDRQAKHYSTNFIANGHIIVKQRISYRRFYHGEISSNAKIRERRSMRTRCGAKFKIYLENFIVSAGKSNLYHNHLHSPTREFRSIELFFVNEGHCTKIIFKLCYTNAVIVTNLVRLALQVRNLFGGFAQMASHSVDLQPSWLYVMCSHVFR